MFRRNYTRAPILWMDAGGFAGDSSAAGRMQTETLIEGMGQLGCVAANVTERELAIGVDEFRALAARAAFPMISANVVHQDDASPVFPAFVRRSFTGPSGRPIRVGILGVTRENPGFLGRTGEGRRVVLAPPASSAARHVPALREVSDVVVLLANLPPRQVDALVSQIPGIDVVLAGWSGRVTAEAAAAARPTIVYGGDQGKRVGEVRLFFGSQGLAQATAGHLFLDGRYPYELSMKEFEDRANLKINDHYRELALATAAAPGEVPAAQRYLGPGGCGECHGEAQRVWEASGHAHAMQTLVEAHLEYSPLCVGCHVTGDRNPGGFVNLVATPQLANVQCEACHGPAGAHRDDPARPYGKADRSGCLVCHTPDNSPDFEFTSYWEKIRH
jgi:hypothetical protein